jgi:hypothetical protein
MGLAEVTRPFDGIDKFGDVCPYLPSPSLPSSYTVYKYTAAHL